MSKQLDILCLEPFYGGVRRAMLETVVRCSRHRWTVLRLPPRRMERRLTAAANWFSEQLSRHWVAKVDLLFTSEAMNLASLYQLTPALAKHPSVVYFHDNQLPDLLQGLTGTHGITPGENGNNHHELVNLNTAASATEIWFNSTYHLQTFQARVAAMVSRHPELSSLPLHKLKAKSRLMPPPVDLDVVSHVGLTAQVRRNPRAIFLETRDADVSLINSALTELSRSGVAYSAITVGPADSLDPSIPRRTIPEHDETAQVRGMLEAGVFASAKTDAASDYLALRAMVAGCRPVLPQAGVYPEVLPHDLHVEGLYPVHPEMFAEHLSVALDSAPSWRYDGFRQAFRPFDAITACRTFDDRLEQLVAAHPHVV